VTDARVHGHGRGDGARVRKRGGDAGPGDHELEESTVDAATDESRPTDRRGVFGYRQHAVRVGAFDGEVLEESLGGPVRDVLLVHVTARACGGRDEEAVAVPHLELEFARGAGGFGRRDFHASRYQMTGVISKGR
jgi:hypothetical protein